ncbi:MAG TPA: AI-2E family transporter [Candidatus Limnocylindrales bacterium]|nr:AI-2E family transporter [Candidatus Limnocylindrales bacterium]
MKPWMVQKEQSGHTCVECIRYSYLFMAGLSVLIVWLHLATLLLAALFAYLALTRLEIKLRWGRTFAVILFVLALGGIAYVIAYFTNQTIHALPEIGEKAIPAIINWAKEHGIELPFTDYDSLKDLAFDTVKTEVQFLASFAKFARGASTQALFLAAGCVVAVSIYLNPRFELTSSHQNKSLNLYSACCQEIAGRFRTLYGSFVTVMGAQIIISAINTVLTGIFVLAFQMPYAVVIIGVTFFCGLLPVVGNLISNTMVVAIGFTVSPRLALGALMFLIVIHKLEYFLNSKIVGWRIHNPLWLTLLGLIVGERLLGIPGMILAPVVLNYIRLEMSRVSVSSA